ncbi:hypothetical protein CAL65_09540 [Alkalilimnicola ehrlichii]|uniref:HTH lysR-type domain-containing protein n=1 Tax=Alkalilimnicola ehrlichii TaxID=351052 RepID=A0A3E0WZS7_9GAMM|nr:hypothetical protein CAL65_09540 [Alkalilimnicola ehrlichii]
MSVTFYDCAIKNSDRNLPCGICNNSGMDKLRCMHIFTRVAELGSFTKTAEEIGISTAQASRAVAELENHVGVRLFNRSTRKSRLPKQASAIWGAAALFWRKSTIRKRHSVPMPTHRPAESASIPRYLSACIAYRRICLPSLHNIRKSASI